MSSGSESDEEYVPEVPEKVSEEESADEETDLQFEKEQEHHKSQKRKSIQNLKGKKKIKTSNGSKETDDESVKIYQVNNSEDEKKREEDLWAKFLEGTDTVSKTAADKANNPTQSQASATIGKTVKPTTINKAKVDDEKERERRIFEFAGETIVVENDVIKERITSTSTEKPAPASNNVGSSRVRGSGLSNVLGQLNKKNKLSTLEKSKLDWTTYKKEEGIEDDIHSHNKGKEGYLDRQDFLERADLRQYEIERDLRMNRRSNR